MATQIFSIFTPYLGKISNSMGLKPPTSLYCLAGKTKDSPPFFSNGQVCRVGRQIFSTFVGVFFLGKVRNHGRVKGGFWGLHFLLTQNTVDGQNPAPPRMMIIPLLVGFYTSQVVQDFFHQQYVVLFFLQGILSRYFWELGGS